MDLSRYIPAPSLLGWHVGFWNLVGAVGFTLCGALGFAQDGGGPVEYALTLSTFVGSWAFLVSFVPRYMCVVLGCGEDADSGGVARLGRWFSGMSRWISIRCWLGRCRFRGWLLVGDELELWFAREMAWNGDGPWGHDLPCLER